MIQHADAANADVEKPWYRQFWPWFLIALPAISVVAGLSTLTIAVLNQDSLVRDDWYKDGKAINQSLARDDAAASPRIRQLSVAEIMAETIRRISNDDSVSSLFID